MKLLTKLILAALAIVPFYAGVSTIILYVLSEEMGILIPRINTLHSILLLIAFIVILIVYMRIQHVRYLIITSCILFLIGIVGYKNFQQLKRAEGTRPKIFLVSPASGIQAQIVKIKGLRFERPSEKGKVVLGQDKMNIQNWNDNFIIAEQPLTHQKGLVELYVERGDGMRSNSVTYEIKDPAELSK